MMLNLDTTGAENEEMKEILSTCGLLWFGPVTVGFLPGGMLLDVSYLFLANASVAPPVGFTVT